MSRNPGHVALTITNADGNTTVEIPHGDKGDKGDRGEQGVPGVTLPENAYKLNEEVVVGTWIDGKPIYRKVIKTTIPSPDRSAKSARLYAGDDIQTIDHLINIYGVYEYPKKPPICRNL